MVSSATSPRPPSGAGPAAGGAGTASLASYLAGVRVFAALGVWLAIAATVTIWLAASGISGASPLVGLAFGLAVLLVAASLATGATATWNRNRWQTLRDWGDTIRAAMRQGAAAGSNPLLARLESTLQRLENDKGPQWISGDGYVSVSRSLGDLEVSAMDAATAGELVREAQYDKMRLTGSTVDNRDALLENLNQAIAVLLSAPDGLVVGSATAPSPAAPPAPATPTSSAPAAATLAAASATVKAVRRALNDYRDSSRESLANLRQKTLDALALAGVLGFFLTLLGALNGSSDTVQLASGAALFLVAAIVGVIAALNGLSNLTKADDDFGLAATRLVASAVLSGLSGVAGVLLVYLSGAAGSLVKAPETASGSLALNQIFNLGTHPVTLVVAAVFGATPKLLVTNLTKLGDQYATNLTSTHPSTTSGASS